VGNHDWLAARPRRPLPQTYTGLRSQTRPDWGGLSDHNSVYLAGAGCAVRDRRPPSLRWRPRRVASLNVTPGDLVENDLDVTARICRWSDTTSTSTSTGAFAGRCHRRRPHKSWICLLAPHVNPDRAARGAVNSPAHPGPPWAEGTSRGHVLHLCCTDRAKPGGFTALSQYTLSEAESGTKINLAAPVPGTRLSGIEAKTRAARPMAPQVGISRDPVQRPHVARSVPFTPPPAGHFRNSGISPYR
jgi:hypothetical protein